MPEKARFYIAVKLLIMPIKLGFPFAALLINQNSDLKNQDRLENASAYG